MNVVPLPERDPQDAREAAATELERLWRVRSLAAHWDCSKPMIFKLLKAGLLTSVKLGTEIRITEESARRYIQRRGGE